MDSNLKAGFSFKPFHDLWIAVHTNDFEPKNPCSKAIKR